ncbi:MAG TPA: L-serine ammonia-lyase [Acidobacteria bacterium]|jgi:L-serine dehydratase|nr:L-serine ammonia-lyase [Acidobacteriota bacterium]
MAISTLDLFKIGIGPSSSHTVGPMIAARLYALKVRELGILEKIYKIRIVLYGSLGATGKGHGTPKALSLGLMGYTPEDVDVDNIEALLKTIENNQSLSLLGQHSIHWRESEMIEFEYKALPYHPNGMRFVSFANNQEVLNEGTYYSVGGGFVVDPEAPPGADPLRAEELNLKYPFNTAKQLLAHCAEHNLSISDVMLANEAAWRSESETKLKLISIWRAMESCVRRGCQSSGMLPGGLRVLRRAPALFKTLSERPENLKDPLALMDWVSLYALAVNEENAAGGKVVTAPTNGAAGIIPSVLHFYRNFTQGSSDEGVIKFLLTAGAIGTLYKKNASISGAEVGCQGEVGSACSMAAGALAEVLGGTPKQVENAAEIAMEHHLGLTCDPIGGLVQIPCIERNAMASVKAIQAARLALHGDGNHFVSLDNVIETMRLTGADMKTKYKETSRGGLALQVVGIPEGVSVNLPEC